MASRLKTRFASASNAPVTVGGFSSTTGRFSCEGVTTPPEAPLQERRSPARRETRASCVASESAALLALEEQVLLNGVERHAHHLDVALCVDARRAGRLSRDAAGHPRHLRPASAERGATREQEKEGEPH